MQELHNEADTRAKLIDPALHQRGWGEDKIKREETPGAVDVVDGKPRKRSQGRIDYTLRVRVNSDTQPVALALIEAKSEQYSPGHGLQQGKEYAAATKRLNVQFVFSTNGHQVVEYDRITGETTEPYPLSKFPTPDDLRQRYENAQGFSLDDDEAKPLLVPYPGGEATRRYYQDAAIRATFEKLAQCEKRGEAKRALLSLATGAGKTFIAVHLLKRIADAGQLRKALFVCDRDELRTQALGAFQNVFGADAAAVSSGNPQKNARILIATYQTLDVDTDTAEANFLTANYPENYFSHIIIDECHRSAWGKWSMVLTRNPEATQIGLTATPRQLKTRENTPEIQADEQISADNIRHFGEPVYEYDISQGNEDGYLAACEIQRGQVDIDYTELTADEIYALGPKDATTGQPLGRDELPESFSKTEYEYRILLPDRVREMTQDLFNHLVATGGPEQKTIIFCVRDTHADEVANAMNNLYARWCADNNRDRVDPYAFKCTAASGGSDYVADLRGASRHHFIATTVDLLSTGVDVPSVKNIVFFKYVRSPIAFYQMVGRGTRLDPVTNKMMFRIYDYTNATRLFGEDFQSRIKSKSTGDGDSSDIPAQPTVLVEGLEVQVTDAGKYILSEVDGKSMPITVEEYKQRLSARIVEEMPNLDDFRTCWIHPQNRRDFMARLPDQGRSAQVVQSLDDMIDYDLYDILAELGYGLAPKTRITRADAFFYKHDQWLNTLPTPTADTLKALTMQFARTGTDGLENPRVFATQEVTQAGGINALAQIGQPADLLIKIKERIFAL